jgi:hypothetical protein
VLVALLRRESRDAMWTPHVQTEHGGYGYGVIVRDMLGRRVIETSGGTIGFVRIAARYSVDDTSIVVM